jgi:hypothetical protein
MNDVPNKCAREIQQGIIGYMGTPLGSQGFLRMLISNQQPKAEKGVQPLKNKAPMSHCLQYVTCLLSLSILLKSCGNPNLQLANHEQAKSSTQLGGLHSDPPSAASGILPHVSSAVTSFAAPVSLVAVASLGTSVPACSVPLSHESVLFEAVSTGLPTQALRHLVLRDADAALAQRIPLLVSSSSYLPQVLSSTATQLPSSASEIFSGASHCYGPFSISSGKEITFSQADGAWHAVVKDTWLDRDELLPVVCRGDVTAILSDLQAARAVDVLHQIHIRECHHASRYVYVGALGLRGGMAKKKKKKKGSSAASAVATDGVDRRRPATVRELLINGVNAYQDYLDDLREDHAVLTRKYLDANKEVDGEWIFQASTDVHRRYNNLIDDIYKLALKLIHLEITVSDCLVKLLEIRKEYLLKRENAIIPWLEKDSSGQGPTRIVPVSERFFNAFTKKNREESKRMNDYSRETSLKYFELLNSLIRDLVPLYTFDPNEKQLNKLLCDSVQLHPILRGQVSALGHPDQCTSLYRIEVILEKFAPEWFAFNDGQLINKNCGEEYLDPAKEIISKIFSLRAVGSEYIKKKRGTDKEKKSARELAKEGKEGFDILASEFFHEQKYEEDTFVEPHFHSLIRTIHNYNQYFTSQVAKMWQECECDVHNKVHDKGELASEQLVRLDFLRTSEDTTTSEVYDEDLLDTNTLYRNQASGEEVDSDEDEAPEASQIALDQKNQESELPTTATEEQLCTEVALEKLATEELDTEDQEISAALHELTEKHAKVRAELQGKLKYDRLVTLISQLGGEVLCGKGGSHHTICSAVGQRISGVVKPHGTSKDSWPGPKVRKSILETAEKLMEQQRVEEREKVKDSNSQLDDPKPRST